MKYLAIHHTAVSRNLNSKQFIAVNNYHRNKYAMISRLGYYVCYNDFIDVNGHTTHTRIWGEEETCANKGHNCDVPERCDTISVCLAGNFDSEVPTEAQNEALQRLIQEIRVIYPHIETVLHRTIQSNRTCPGGLFTDEYLNITVLKKRLFLPDSEDVEKSIKIIELSKSVSLLQRLIQQLIKLLAKL